MVLEKILQLIVAFVIVTFISGIVIRRSETLDKMPRHFVTKIGTVTAVIGFSLYFIGYLPNEFDFFLYFQAFIRALFSTIRMFLANDDFGYLSSIHPSLTSTNSFITDFDKAINISLVTKLYILLLWIVNTVAVSITFTLAMSIFGQRLLFRIRMFAGCWGNTYIIFGVNNKSLYFAESLYDRKKSASIVFIGKDVSEKDKKRIFSIGAALYDDDYVKEDKLNPRMIKTIDLDKESKLRNVLCKFDETLNEIIMTHKDGRFNKLKLFVFSKLSAICKMYSMKKYIVYAFSDNDLENYTFINYLKNYFISEYRVFYKIIERLTVYMQTDNIVYIDELEKLREIDEDYEFKKLRKIKEDDKLDFRIFGEGSLAAKNLLKKSPVYNALKIANGLACEELNILILGFGRVGRAVLREIISQGIFYTKNGTGTVVPNRVHAYIVDDHADVQESKLKLKYPQLTKNFDIKFIRMDATGSGFLKYMENDHIINMKYVIVTLGDDYKNARIAMELKELYVKMELKAPIIFAHIRDEGDENQHLPMAIKSFGSFKEIYRNEHLTDNDVYYYAVLFKSLYNIINEVEQKIKKVKDVDKKHQCEELKTNIVLKEFCDSVNAFNNLKLGSFGRNEYTEQELEFEKQRIIEQMSNIACVESINSKLKTAGIDMSIFEIRKMNKNGNEKEYDRFKNSNYIRNTDILMRLEHLRWNAFHITNGWRSLGINELKQRAEKVKFEDKNRKDNDSKQHACIIEWDDLDELAELYGEDNNKFKYYDEMFIKALPYMLFEKAREEFLKGNSGYDIESFEGIIKENEGTEEIKQIEENEKNKESMDSKDDNEINRIDAKITLESIVQNKQKPQTYYMLDILKEEKICNPTTCVYNNIDIETLANEVHIVWMKGQEKSGWRYGEQRDDKIKVSPCMVPYEELTEEEKEKDRITARAVIDELFRKSRNRT